MDCKFVNPVFAVKAHLRSYVDCFSIFAVHLKFWSYLIILLNRYDKGRYYQVPMKVTTSLLLMPFNVPAIGGSQKVIFIFIFSTKENMKLEICKVLVILSPSRCVLFTLIFLYDTLLLLFNLEKFCLIESRKQKQSTPQLRWTNTS